MTIQEAHRQLLFALYGLYDNREAANIADLIIEHVTGQRRIDRIVNKQMPVGLAAQKELADMQALLLQHTPVQYVLHEAWFAGLKFYVDDNVLIPRPETEELVQWVVGSWLQVAGCKFQDEANDTSNGQPVTSNLQPVTRLLDIGTGSGCIPIAVKKKWPGWDVHALDISATALQVAQKNAADLQAPITFYETDILNELQWPPLPIFDIIVSNPPYIKNAESAAMRDNVTRFEPHTALFVPDDDALLFYRQIARFALRHLRPNGLLFFEINEAFGAEVCLLLANNGFTGVELQTDMQGKHRMVKAVLPTANA